MNLESIAPYVDTKKINTENSTRINLLKTTNTTNKNLPINRVLSGSKIKSGFTNNNTSLNEDII